MVLVDKEYLFEGVNGQARLIDLFEGRRQLVIQHFMFDPSWDDGCPSCTATADEPVEVPGYSCFLLDGDRVYHTYSTYARGTEFAVVKYAFLDLTALGRQDS